MFSDSQFTPFPDLSEKNILLNKIISLHEKTFKLLNLMMTLENAEPINSSEMKLLHELSLIKERLFLVQFQTGRLRDQVKKMSYLEPDLRNLYLSYNAMYESCLVYFNRPGYNDNQFIFMEENTGNNSSSQNEDDNWDNWDENLDSQSEFPESDDSELNNDSLQSFLMGREDPNSTIPAILPNNVVRGIFYYSRGFFHPPVEKELEVIDNTENKLSL
jgi:hypothetical protein